MSGDEGTAFDRGEVVDVLIVFTDKGNRVVEAPMCKAVVGSVVEFTVGDWTHRGEVLELMTCERDSQAYRCISRVADIRKATKIYSCTWPEILAE